MLSVSEPLLHTKLIVPPLRPQLVSRPRLDEKLRRIRHLPLALVSAPPGFGKTTATLSALLPLAAEEDVQLAWLSLASEDDEPVRFWRYVIAALQRATSVEGEPLLGEEVAQALTSPQPPFISSLLPGLLNGIAARSQDLLLVLDDAHLITHSDIYQGLGFLLEHAPPNLHLLLATRADPPLPLHRLRARGQLVEVRAHDLRFDAKEAAAFLREGMGLPLDDEQIARLNEQTEGWISGLQLAALAWQGQDGDDAEDEPDLIVRLSQSNRYIAEYLVEEVLARQPDHLRAFLLQTAILERLSGPLCDAVTGGNDGAHLLETLAHRNLFVVPLTASGTDEHAWYRYHQLFADLLRGHLRQEQPDRIPALHRRAAEWYETEGEVEVAVGHALAGEAYTQVGRLLERHGPALAMAGRALTLERWLQQLPASELAALPRTNLAFAWALLLRGRYDELEPYLRRAAAAIGENRALRGEWHALQASLAGTRGQAEDALDHAQQALAEVGVENRFVQALAHFALGGAQRELGEVVAAIAAYEQAIPLCRAARLTVPELLARAHLGYLYLLQGRLRRAEAVLQPVLSTAAGQPIAAAAHASLGLVFLAQNRLEEAEVQLQQGLALAAKSGHNAAAVHSQIALSRLHRVRGDWAAAESTLEAAAVRVQEGVPGWVEPLLVAEQVNLWLEQGALAPAARLLAESEAPVGAVRDVLLPVRARLLLAQERPEAARALLDDLLQRADSVGRQGQVIEALLLRARAHLALGEGAAAATDLQRALLLAELEGYVRVFVEAGAALAPLLAAQPGEYARRLLAAFPPAIQATAEAQAPPGEKAPVTLPEPLTERESEVLQLMARGLTYQQIADELVVSVNTVRHHVKGLYGKLQVNRRTQALAKARDLQLLQE